MWWGILPGTTPYFGSVNCLLLLRSGGWAGFYFTNPSICCRHLLELAQTLRLHTGRTNFNLLSGGLYIYSFPTLPLFASISFRNTTHDGRSHLTATPFVVRSIMFCTQGWRSILWTLSSPQIVISMVPGPNTSDRRTHLKTAWLYPTTHFKFHSCMHTVHTTCSTSIYEAYIWHSDFLFSHSEW